MTRLAKSLFNFNCGVYCIKNIITNKYYVGSSVKISKRKNFHFLQLKKNCHHSIKLQKSYNKYGEKNFYHYTLEVCDKNDLKSTELKWNVYFNSFNNGYNCTNETDAPWRGKKIPLHIKKLQKCQPVKIINPNGELFEDYSITNFCKTQNLHVGAISDVLKGKTYHHKGWRRFNESLINTKFDRKKFIDFLGDKNTKIKCKLVDPDGNIIEIENLSKFIKKNQFENSGLYKVVSGKHSNFWGWRLANENTIGVKYIPKLLRKKKYVE